MCSPEKYRRYNKLLLSYNHMLSMPHEDHFYKVLIKAHRLFKKTKTCSLFQSVTKIQGNLWGTKNFHSFFSSSKLPRVFIKHLDYELDISIA